MDDLKVLLDANNVQYTEKTLIIDPDGIPNGYPNQTIENLSKDFFDEDSRIFIIHTYEPLAREIICEAYRQGYMYPRYVFFAIPWYVDRWWTVEEDSYGCTVEQREEVLEHSITLMNLPFAKFLNGSLETDTGNGLTVDEYFDTVDLGYLNKPPLNLSFYDDVAPVCYDAMWTLALALNNTIEEFESNTSLSDMAHIAENMTERNQTFRIENFSYKNNIVMETMFKHLENTDFLGVSGNVTFNELGIRRVTEYLILQFRRNETGYFNNSVVGHWSENDSVIFEPGENNTTTWPLGIPYDGVSVNEEVVAVHVSITVILTVLSCAGIIFSIVCLVFNFHYRNQTLIRLTSPNLNYLIGSGAIVLYVAIILTVIPARSAVFAGVLCNLRVWLTGFGLSLCYGTILVKMWRVYYIFSNPSAQKKANLHDWKLALMVLCFVVIDLVMLVVFSAVEGSKGKLGADRVLDKEHKAITEGDQGRIRKYYVYICASMARDIFLGVFYGYKALLQVCGLFLAFATRKVKVKGLDDAKWIAATIYITSIVLAIIILAVYTLNDLSNTHSAVFTGGIFIGTTFIMAFVFVPKMHTLYKDPKGTKVFGKSGPSDPADKSSFEHSGRRVSESMQGDKKG